MQVANLALRFVQFIFIIIILGLSGALVAGQIVGHNSTTDYVLFCAVWGMLVVLIGIVSNFVTSLQGMVMAALDGLTTIFYLAGSIALAARLGAHSCSFVDRKPTYYLAYNPITNAGESLPFLDGVPQYDQRIPYTRRCRMAQADTAFMFFTLAAFAASSVVSIMGSRK